MEFVPFPKIARLSRECIITEKIDGTNASILITEDGKVQAASRTRWITPEDDNFGFAAWVKSHEDEIRTGLGLGHHFGEWWGGKIQRGYGLKEKRFSLFNVTRWKDQPLPAGIQLVPVLYEGIFDTNEINESIRHLSVVGSLAAPGFMDPEGVVIYHAAANMMFKKTIKGDEKPKGSKE